MSGRVHHGGALDRAIRRFGGRRQDWLDLSTGINPEGIEIPALPADIWRRLPEQELLESVLEKARAFYDAPEGSTIVAAPGTQSLIQVLPGLFGAAGRVDIVSPTYGEYSASFSRHGWTIGEAASAERVSADAKLAVVVNPNNPDGRITRPDAIATLAGKLSRAGGAVVVDEAFLEASPAASSAGLAAGRGAIVLKSFGKFFGLAGMRLGFAIAGPDIAERLTARLGPWAVSGPALALADHALGDTDAIEEMRVRIAESAASLARVLDEAGMESVGATGLFRLVRHEDAGALHDALCRRRVLVRRFDYRAQWLRFGLARRSAYARLGDALGGAIAEIAG